MSEQSSNEDDIEGTVVFTGRRSQRGYNLNLMAFSLHLAENREAYRRDPDEYMDRYHLTLWERQKLAAKDWNALVSEGGGSIYMLIKIGAVTGDGLVDIGAQQRGETAQEFVKSRNVPLRENM